jgi:hypothetical protein
MHVSADSVAFSSFDMPLRALGTTCVAFDDRWRTIYSYHATKWIERSSNAIESVDVDFHHLEKWNAVLVSPDRVHPSRHSWP